MGDEKFFSLAEANALVPQFEMILERTPRVHLRIRQEIKLLAINSDQCAHDMMTTQLLRLKTELRPFFVELSQSVHKREALGGDCKGQKIEVVDFPGQINGKIVELCWQYREKEISCYHSHCDEFAGRRPLKPVSTHVQG